MPQRPNPEIHGEIDISLRDHGAISIARRSERSAAGGGCPAGVLARRGAGDTHGDTGSRLSEVEGMPHLSIPTAIFD
jgi:hypothetical protein